MQAQEDASRVSSCELWTNGMEDVQIYPIRINSKLGYQIVTFMGRVVDSTGGNTERSIQ